MSKSIFGIINSCDRSSRINGLEEYRPIGAFTFGGRYRVIDFIISNMSNSGINQIQIFTGSNPLSLTDHIGTGRQYNINSKRGRIHTFFSKHATSYNLYNTAISCFIDNLPYIANMPQEYVLVAPAYMIYIQDYQSLLDQHIESGADITFLYQSVDTAKEDFLYNLTIEMDKNKRVTDIQMNPGTAKNRNIMMDTCIMKKSLFVSLVESAIKTSSLYSLYNIIDDNLSKLNVVGVPHRGYFVSINDFNSYYKANLGVIDTATTNDLFRDDWTIYTQTTDAPPTKYLENADVKRSVIANGGIIKGSVENSIIGREVTVEPGAIIRNSIIMSDTYIGKDVHVENQIVDKHVVIDKIKQVVSDPSCPGYIKKSDRV